MSTSGSGVCEAVRVTGGGWLSGEAEALQHATQTTVELVEELGVLLGPRAPEGGQGGEPLRHQGGVLSPGVGQSQVPRVGEGGANGEHDLTLLLWLALHDGASRLGGRRPLDLLFVGLFPRARALGRLDQARPADPRPAHAPDLREGEMRHVQVEHGARRRRRRAGERGPRRGRRPTPTDRARSRHAATPQGRGSRAGWRSGPPRPCRSGGPSGRH